MLLYKPDEDYNIRVVILQESNGHILHMVSLTATKKGQSLIQKGWERTEDNGVYMVIIMWFGLLIVTVATVIYKSSGL